jgi:SET domain-containing protein
MKMGPNNLTFVEIPLGHEFRGTDELSFVLRPSAIAGVGVFITHPVKKGTKLDLFPDTCTRKVSYEDMGRDPRLEAFCLCYGVEFPNGVSVADNFSRMAVGWYVNHSLRPNAYHDEDWDYYASRDIAAGEEITIDYRQLAA